MKYTRCPYDNHFCPTNGHAYVVCKECYGEPDFVVFSCGDTTITANELYVEFKLFHKDQEYSISYHPLTNKLNFYCLNKFKPVLDLTIMVQEPITPANVQSYLEKVMNLKAFL